MAGLSITGFERKRLVDVKADIETALKAAFGDNIDLQAQSVFGQLVGIFSEVIADQWEELENVYNAMYPSTASGTALSNVVQFTGITKLEAVNSTVTLTFTGTDGTAVPVGFEVATSDTGVVFTTIGTGTIASGTLDLEAESLEAGAFEAAAGTLTDIQTPQFGVLSVTNAEDAVIGRDIESDAELRIRREESVSIAGLSHEEATAAQLLQVDDVFDATVTSNGTDDAVDGIPAHSFRCVVRGGTNEDIAEVIWTNTPQGILSYGGVSVFVTDIQGYLQEVQFTRASIIPIYFDIDITVDSDLFPTDGEDLIAENIVEYGLENFKISDDVLINRFFAPIMSVDGVLDAVIRMDTTTPPTGTSNITITSTRISVYSTSYIGVNIV